MNRILIPLVVQLHNLSLEYKLNITSITSSEQDQVRR